MIRKFCSFITGGFITVLVIVVGGIGLFIYSQKEKFLYKSTTKGDSNVLGEATINLESKIDNLEKNLEDSGVATLILDEFEAEEFLKSYISNANIKWLPIKQDDFYLDFALNNGYFHSRSFFDLDFLIQTVAEETDSGTYYPKLESVKIGPISLPKIISEKIDGVVYQAVEQLKTENLGGRKITKLRFMQDKVVIEFEKV